MESHKILFEKTAHYNTIGTPGKHIKYLWIACHGYGQLASLFIHKFDKLDANENFILAPEGLSRFYWNRSSPNPVGSSWMTKQNRLDEIADYTRFIKKLYDEYVPQMADDVEIILFGFSQGCATQIRWMMGEFPIFHHLVLWAGLLPEDLDYTPHSNYFSTKKLYWVCGNQDQFINEEKAKWHHDFMKEQSLNFETIRFEGKHEIDRTELQKLFTKIKGNSNVTQS